RCIRGVPLLLGAARLSPRAFDFGDNLFQRKLAEPFSALGGVVAGPRTKLPQETKRIHDPQVPSQNFAGSAVDLGDRSNDCAHGTTFITSSSGVTTATFNDFSRCAFFRSLSSQPPKHPTSAYATNARWSESRG